MITMNRFIFLYAFPLMKNDPNETNRIYLRTILISSPF